VAAVATAQPASMIRNGSIGALKRGVSPFTNTTLR
jgi:hypothetical protein